MHENDDLTFPDLGAVAGPPMDPAYSTEIHEWPWLRWVRRQDRQTHRHGKLRRTLRTHAIFWPILLGPPALLMALLDLPAEKAVALWACLASVALIGYAAGRVDARRY